MNPTRQEIAEAAQKCIDKIWGPRARGQNSPNGYFLCKIMDFCAKCPMHGRKLFECCEETKKWSQSFYAESPLEEYRVNAQPIVDKLERIVKEYSEEEL